MRVFWEWLGGFWEFLGKRMAELDVESPRQQSIKFTYISQPFSRFDFFLFF